MVTLTEHAATRIKRTFEEQKMPPSSCLRLAVKGGGCSGFSYVLDVTGGPAEEDYAFTSNGVTVVVDPKSCIYVDGTEIDYQDKLLGGGFVFNNPNAKNRCGCGASFRA